MASYYDNSPIQQVSGTVHIDNNPLPVSGTVAAAPPAIRFPTMTRVAAVTSSVVLAAGNPNRKQLWIFNTGSALFVGLNTVSTSSYFLRIDSDGYWELPTAGGVFVGDVLGVWASASGGAMVTEVR